MGPTHWKDNRASGDSASGEYAADADTEGAAMYHGMFESMPVAAVISRSDGTIVEVNAAACELYGMDRSELVGRNVLDRVDPEYHHFAECAQRSVAMGEPFQVETVHLRGDGEPVAIEQTAAAVRQGERVLTASLLRDITTQRTREEDLDEARTQYRSLFDSAHVGYFRSRTEDGSLIDANDQLAQMLGYDSEADIDSHRVPWLHCVDPAMNEKVLESVQTDGEIAGWDVEYFRRDGTLAWGRLWARAQADEYDESVECVLADVTDEKLALEALRRERDFASKLVETAHAVVAVLGLSGRILRFNRFARELTGYDDSEVLGKDWLETFIESDERKSVREAFASVIEGRPTVGLEGRVMCKSGRQVSMQWYVSCLSDLDGRAVGLLLIGHDVTEMRRKAGQIRDEAKMEAIGRLAGGIAHDFNNQLTIVKGYCDLLLREVPNRPELELPIREIQAATSQAASLTRELLVFSRRQALHPESVNVSRTLESMADPLTRMLGEDITLTMDLAEDLPAVTIDETHLEQTIINLAANARDAMPRGGEMTIATSAAHLDVQAAAQLPEAMPGDYVRLRISDTGCGMDEETLRQIFEPFFTTKPVGKGSGLGLSAAYGFVRQSGGYIRVASEPGRGATFEIFLPVVTATEAGARQETQAPPAEREAGPAWTKGTILVAEDSQAVRQILVRILRDEGYEVLEAPGGREALRLADDRDGEIDLLVTDVVMPDVSGVELAHYLRKARPGTEVLYISGYVGDALSKRGLDESIENLLSKPFDPSDLIAAVRRLLKRRAETGR